MGGGGSSSNSDPPSYYPSFDPSFYPSFDPSYRPSFDPSRSPSYTPTFTPSYVPSAIPTVNPTRKPSATPTYSPTYTPTASPTRIPTAIPTVVPTSVVVYPYLVQLSFYSDTGCQQLISSTATVESTLCNSLSVCTQAGTCKTLDIYVQCQSSQSFYTTICGTTTNFALPSTMTTTSTCYSFTSNGDSYAIKTECKITTLTLN